MGYCCHYAAAAAAAAFNLFRVLPVLLQTWNFAPRSSMLSYMTAQNFVRFRPFGPELWGKKGVFWANFPKHRKYSSFITLTLLVMVWFWNFAQAFYMVLRDAWKNIVRFRPFLPELRGKRGFLGWDLVSARSRTFKFYHWETSSNDMILKFCTVFLYVIE